MIFEWGIGKRLAGLLGIGSASNTQPADTMPVIGGSSLHHYTLTAGTGTYTQTGVAATFLHDRAIQAAVGTYAQTGVAAGLFKGYELIAIGASGTPWNISTGIYSNKSLNVSSQTASPEGIVFNPDGTILYVAGDTSDIHQYTLSSAYDLSTAAYASKVLDVSGQDVPIGIAFSPDGSKFYIAGYNTSTLYQYTVSTPWDISTGSYASKSLVPSPGTAQIGGIAFSSDGTKLYIQAADLSIIWQYTVGTPYDISTATYSSLLYDFTSLGTVYTFGISFKPDGTILYLTSEFNGSDVGVYQVSLGTPWNISTASYSGSAGVPQLNTNSQDTNPEGVTLSPDGNSLYVSDNATGFLYQYSVVNARYVVVGNTDSFAYDRVIQAAVGTYTQTGVIAKLLYGKLVIASTGTYSQTGVSVTFLTRKS